MKIIKKIRSFTLIELLMVIAIVGILISIAKPIFLGFLHKSHAIQQRGGEWDMFRWIELIGILVIFWFIANFVRYIVYATSGLGADTEGMPMSWLFGMANGWIKNAETKKQQKETGGKQNTNKVDELRKRTWNK